MNFFEKFRGFNGEIAQEFAHSLVPHSRTHATFTFKGLLMEKTLEFISIVTTVPLGIPWSKDEKPIGQATTRNFFQNNETPIED